MTPQTPQVQVRRPRGVRHAGAQREDQRGLRAVLRGRAVAGAPRVSISSFTAIYVVRTRLGLIALLNFIPVQMVVSFLKSIVASAILFSSIGTCGFFHRINVNL